MKKIFLYFLVLLPIITFAQLYPGDEALLEINMPENIGSFEDFTLNIKIKNKELRETANSIVVEGVNIEHDPVFGEFKNKINYKGEEEINIKARINYGVEEPREQIVRVYFETVEYLGNSKNIKNTGVRSVKLEDDSYDWYNIKPTSLDQKIRHIPYISKKFGVVPANLRTELPKLDLNLEGFENFNGRFSAKYRKNLNPEETGVLEFYSQFDYRPQTYNSFMYWVKRISDQKDYLAFFKQSNQGRDWEKENKYTNNSKDGYYRISKRLDKEYKEVKNPDGKYEQKHTTSRVELGYHLHAILNNGFILSGTAYKEARVDAGGEESFYVSAEKEINSFISNIRIERSNKTLTIEGVDQGNDGGNCKEDKDCNTGERCSACEKCTKEPLTDPINIKKIDYSLEPQISEKKIKNIITKLSAIRIPIKADFIDSSDKKIDYCSIASPGLKDRKISAEFTNELPFAGFTNGFLNDERKNKEECVVKFGDPEFKCLFIVSPNDLKKNVEETGIIKEKIKIQAEGKEIETEIELLPITTEEMKVEFQMSGEQVQDGGIKSIKVKASNIDVPSFLMRISLSGPGGLFRVAGSDLKAKEAAELATQRLTFVAKENKFEEFGYKAPSLSNTSFAELLSNAKSIGELQLEAAKQIAWDAAMNYTGDALGKLTDKFNPDQKKQVIWNRFKNYTNKNPNKLPANKVVEIAAKNTETIKDFERRTAIAKALQLRMGLNDLQGTQEGIKGLSGDFKTVAGQKKEASWSEKGAEIGVAAVDLAQMSVGVLTLVPSKIPVVGQATAGFKTAFSAMTNIWKANFQYIASNEKMSRAQELFYPVGIIVSTEDMSGWNLLNLALIKIAYHQL